MSKLWITLMCVFLAVLIIGCVVYPKMDMQGTIDSIKIAFDPIGTAMNFVTNTIDMVFIGSKVKNELNNVEIDSFVILSSLRIYIPYHIDKYDLRDRCSNQNFNYFVSRSYYHDEHLTCHLKCNVETEYYTGYFDIDYCAICNELIACYYMHSFFVKQDQVLVLYPYNSLYAPLQSWVANTFNYNEVTEYIGSLN